MTLSGFEPDQSGLELRIGSYIVNKDCQCCYNVALAFSEEIVIDAKQRKTIALKNHPHFYLSFK